VRCRKLTIGGAPGFAPRLLCDVLGGEDRGMGKRPVEKKRRAKRIVQRRKMRPLPREVFEARGGLAQMQIPDAAPEEEGKIRP